MVTIISQPSFQTKQDFTPSWLLSGWLSLFDLETELLIKVTQITYAPEFLTAKGMTMPKSFSLFHDDWQCPK